MIRTQHIYCPKGNQLEEMGMSAERTEARNFLCSFTNSEMFRPFDVRIAQQQAGYSAFIHSSPAIRLGLDTAFEDTMSDHLPFIIHADPVYSRKKIDELRRQKYHNKAILNEMKSKRQIEKSLEAQLEVELDADYWLFEKYVLHNPQDSIEAVSRFADEMGLFYRITCQPFEEAGLNYATFLQSPYHYCLPYIWIRACLWAHLMQRPNKIQNGDNLDVEWAAAYLPFADYAVTDDAFCKLLQSSGLAEQYHTKVYSFKTLTPLLDELKILVQSS